MIYALIIALLTLQNAAPVLELSINAPCHMGTIPVLVSEDWRGARRRVYWTNIPNSAPCVHRQILPLVWNNWQPDTKEKK